MRGLRQVYDKSKIDPLDTGAGSQNCLGSASKARLELRQWLRAKRSAGTPHSQGIGPMVEDNDLKNTLGPSTGVRAPDAGVPEAEVSHHGLFLRSSLRGSGRDG